MTQTCIRFSPTAWLARAALALAALMFGPLAHAQEAIRIGSRILLLSPHPGQVKAEINSDGEDRIDPVSGIKLSDRIHGMLFADHVEDTAAPGGRVHD